jgi:hypothetical protein
VKITPIKDWIAAAIYVVYEESGFADEVVVVFVDGKVVYRFLA